MFTNVGHHCRNPSGRTIHVSRRGQTRSIKKLLNSKEINPRQYQVLEYLASRPSGIKLYERNLWYRSIYRNVSAATESRDWKNLLPQGLVEKTEHGVVSLKRM